MALIFVAMINTITKIILQSFVQHIGDIMPITGIRAGAEQSTELKRGRNEIRNHRGKLLIGLITLVCSATFLI